MVGFLHEIPAHVQRKRAASYQAPLYCPEREKARQDFREPTPPHSTPPHPPTPRAPKRQVLSGIFKEVKKTSPLLKTCRFFYLVLSWERETWMDEIYFLKKTPNPQFL